ncbi:phosducin-like protein 3 [Pecten maximus]|uniref:phosducin-like protein 3 n=1 Tax=Pecten maximus TaxID=6579 RepID=UPI0014587147|nr:phosducin-like protein 3 [Pecten maximus]
MQDPNADTEWNDILRAKGIIPEKEQEVTEDDVVHMLEQTIQDKARGKDLCDMSLQELEDKEDDIDEEEERIFEAYRRQRMAEMKAAAAKAKFGSVLEITKEDWVREINKAGDGIWVVLHVYKPGIPLCTLINQHMLELARKFPDVKFVKSVSSVCIPNYPDKNLPTIFVYHENEMKKQWVGPHNFGGMNFKRDEFEWMLSQNGVLKTDLEGPPKQAVDDVMSRAVRESAIDSDDENDW